MYNYIVEPALKRKNVQFLRFIFLLKNWKYDLPKKEGGEKKWKIKTINI